MRKITNENMKQLASDLLQTVGTEDFKVAKIYYKNGEVELSTTPISDQLYVDDKTLMMFYDMALSSTKERSVGEFREFMEGFAKTHYDAALLKDLEKVQAIYSKVLTTKKEFMHANHSRAKTMTKQFMLPVTSQQKKAFTLFKKSLDELGATIIPVEGDNSGVCYAQLNIDYDDVEYIVNMRRQMMITKLDKLVSRMKRKEIDATEEIIEFGKKYDKFLSAFDGLDEKMAKINSLLDNYENSSSIGENHRIVKDLAACGYTVRDLKVYKGAVQVVDLVGVNLLVPNIKLIDGVLKIETSSAGMLTVDELDTHMEAYSRAKQAVELINSLVSFYFKEQDAPKKEPKKEVKAEVVEIEVEPVDESVKVEVKAPPKKRGRRATKKAVATATKTKTKATRASRAKATAKV